MTMISDDEKSARTGELEQESINLRVGLRDWAHQIDRTLVDIERWLRVQQQRQRRADRGEQ